jgi:predicted DNA binding protein/putative methionine-R-sulfoxide reductase with GAF domain
VVRVADEVLGLSSVVVYQWDGEANSLRPMEWSDDFGSATDVECPPELEGPDWIGWTAFVDGESRRIDDLHETDTPFEGASPYRSGLLIPLGEFGLLASGAERPGVYTDVDVEFAETLAANATVAMERASREQRLQRQAERLDDQSTELRRANRRTQVLRAVASADVDGLDFVWVGDWGASDDPLEPRAWAGTAGASLLDEVSGCLDSCDGTPAGKAAETGETQVVSNLLADGREHAWRRGMLANGFSSTVAVPLVYDDVVYGVLELASEQDEAFGDQFVAVLEEVGDLLANAVLAVTRRNTLLGDERRTELEFQLADTDGCGLLFQIAGHLDAAVSLQELVTDDEEAFLAYVSVDDADPETVLESLDRAVSATDARLVESSADASLFEVRLTDLGIMEAVTAHGGTIRGLEATGTTGRLCAGVPSNTEVRSFVDTIRDQYPTATLVAQRDTSASDQHWSRFAALDAPLTDRQREVLQVAYYGGYFEWPREQTGEELADHLDIASPTFQQHLREATRKVLRSMYESHAADE